MTKYAVTLGGRYFVVRGRLNRPSDPQLLPQEQYEVHELVDARRVVGSVTRKVTSAAETQSQTRVDAATTGWSIHGPAWRSDRAADQSRRGVRDTDYPKRFGSHCPDSANG